jgi:glycopeptide antibiotics resistance protein
MYGKIVIRCQSADYPEVYTDLEIKSRLFVTAYGFVRKFMGHGLLSALLGFGIFGSALMLLKRKWIAFPLTALSSCVYAVGSEFIQYFTPQRYCSLSDIVIDTIGAIGGMLVAAIIVAFICVVWKAVSSSSFSKLKTQFYRINLKTVFPHKNKNSETNLNNN